MHWKLKYPPVVMISFSKLALSAVTAVALGMAIIFQTNLNVINYVVLEILTALFHMFLANFILSIIHYPVQCTLMSSVVAGSMPCQ